MHSRALTKPPLQVNTAIIDPAQQYDDETSSPQLGPASDLELVLVLDPLPTDRSPGQRNWTARPTGALFSTLLTLMAGRGTAVTMDIWRDREDCVGQAANSGTAKRITWGLCHL